MSAFRVTSRFGQARRGILRTPHGSIATPFFMPIATRGVVKGLDPDDLRALGAEIILSNTYHLLVRPGMKLLRRFGGLRAFMGWKGPILTDSGGYQVFSLAKHRTLSNRGVVFRDDVTGDQHLLTPERVIDIQRTIGSDIMMVLDECPAYPATRENAKRSMDLTTSWALRSLAAAKRRKIRPRQQLFAIVQGSIYPNLRTEHARTLSAHDFDGFALGGLAVGEPHAKRLRALDAALPELPADKPRYLMGIGKPDQILDAVKRGIDMFDCVIPTRNARHGTLFVWRRKDLAGRFYEELHLSNARFASDRKPIDPTCGCSTCKRFPRAYIRHLFAIREPLGLRLATTHNVAFILDLMSRIRTGIARRRF